MAYRTKICDNGGIFNVSRPSAYSAETRTFINDLIKECRLTTLQRKSLQERLGSGPSIGKTRAAATPHRKTPAAAVVKRYRPQRPRTLRDIVESGAYEPDAYRPIANPKNYGAEKEKLQSIMAFGKVTKLDAAQVVHKKSITEQRSRELTDEELVDSAIAEIEDRERFVADMEKLGRAAKYRAGIADEIRERITKIESFVGKTSGGYRLTEVRDIAEKYRKPTGPPRDLLPPPSSLFTD